MMNSYAKSVIRKMIQNCEFCPSSAVWFLSFEKALRRLREEKSVRKNSSTTAGKNIDSVLFHINTSRVYPLNYPHNRKQIKKNKM